MVSPPAILNQDFSKSLETINNNIIKLNSNSLTDNSYNLWRKKINKDDSTKLIIDNLNGLNYELRYYFWLNYKLDLKTNPSTEIRDKVLSDAFFINNGFDFYSALWYLQPYLTIDQDSYY